MHCKTQSMCHYLNNRWNVTVKCKHTWLTSLYKLSTNSMGRMHSVETWFHRELREIRINVEIKGMAMVETRLVRHEGNVGHRRSSRVVGVMYNEKNINSAGSFLRCHLVVAGRNHCLVLHVKSTPKAYFLLQYNVQTILFIWTYLNMPKCKNIYQSLPHVVTEILLSKCRSQKSTTNVSCLLPYTVDGDSDQTCKKLQRLCKCFESRHTKNEEFWLKFAFNLLKIL